MRQSHGPPQKQTWDGMMDGDCMGTAGVQKGGRPGRLNLGVNLDDGRRTLRGVWARARWELARSRSLDHQPTLANSPQSANLAVCPVRASSCNSQNSPAREHPTQTGGSLDAVPAFLLHLPSVVGMHVCWVGSSGHAVGLVARGGPLPTGKQREDVRSEFLSWAVNLEHPDSAARCSVEFRFR